MIIRIFSFCFLFFSSLTFALQAAQIHAILVADTISVGGEKMETNIDMMQREMKRIAALTELPVHVAIFEHYETRFSNLVSYIDNLNIDTDDIIIFYINIHGDRQISKVSQWPDLIFSVDQLVNPTEYKIDFEILCQILKDKNARFLLAIAESCNSFVNGLDFFASSDDSDSEDKNSKIDDLKDQNVDLLSTIFLDGPTLEYHIFHDDKFLIRIRDNTDESSMEHYHQWFLNSNGTVLIAASSPGEVAAHGIFTPVFLESMDSFNLSYQFSWDQLLEITSENVKQRFELFHPDQTQKVQTIQYELQIY
jgi:hypothetical protein